jgi:predicted CXXCH cytochrome family protein
VRRWTLLLAGAALWLFLAAIPALADGGPHVSSANSGSSALTADGCAGCHRAHTAKSLKSDGLLAASAEEVLCLSCHATAGVGASTDVESGIQYKVANPVGGSAQGASNIIGALRGGGFVSARIDSGNATRAGYTTKGSAPYTTPIDPGKSWAAKIGVLAAGEPVTSAHLKLTGATLVTLTSIAWGNGASGAGSTLSLTCTSCHNPHGNNQYRILVPVPTGTAPFAATNASAVTSVTDDTANTSIVSSVGGTDIRNYTVIQANPAGGRYLLAGAISTAEVLGTFSNTSGDYWHKVVPWTLTASTSADYDGPNGNPSTFDTQITTWCAQCHTRYPSSTTTSPPDPFAYKHSTSSNKACTTCHVAHGTNATMDGFYSGNYPYPDTTTSGSSRLLKVDNRGTCQLCHDPTKTVLEYGPTLGANGNSWTGPTPAPTLP